MLMTTLLTAIQKVCRVYNPYLKRVRVRVGDEKRDWKKTTPPKLEENHAPQSRDSILTLTPRHVTLF